MVLHDAIEHGVGHSVVGNPLVPVLNGQFRGDDGGLVAGPAVDDLQQVAAGVCIQPHYAPVIEQQHIRVLERIQPGSEGAVCVVDAKLFGHPYKNQSLTRVRLS